MGGAMIEYSGGIRYGWEMAIGMDHSKHSYRCFASRP